MESTEDQIFGKYGRKKGKCRRNTLFPYEYEFTCISCGYNVIKRKHETSKIQRRKINFMKRLNYAEQEMFCIFIDVYKIYESNDCDKIYEVLSKLKNRKLKISKILIEKDKDMLENPEFEQDYYSRTAESIYKI